MKLTDKEMEAWAKEITSASMFKERTQEDRDSEEALGEEILKSLRMWRITCQYGKHEYSNDNYGRTYTFIYNDGKTEWKPYGIIMCNTYKEDDELTTELQKQLDETYYYKNVTNPDGNYTQYLMKGDKCYGFHTYTKEEIEGIRKLEQKIEHEMWYGEYTKNKQAIDSLTEKYFVDSLIKVERELWGLKDKENMSADIEPKNYWNEEYNKFQEEQWEKKRREELEAELPNSMYEIGASPYIALTGKGGYIDYLITLEKEFRKMSVDKEPNKDNVCNPTYMKKLEEQWGSSKPNLTEGHSEIEMEKQRVWEKHNKHEGAVKGYKKDRNKQTHLTPPKKKRK